MRKDAKIGFAIGGVLLVVLTVYAIVVPKHKKPVAVVSIVNAPSTEAPAAPPLFNSGGSNSPSTPATPPVDPTLSVRVDPALNVPPAPVPPVADANNSTSIPDAGSKTDEVKNEKPPALTPDRTLTPGGSTTVARTKPVKHTTAEDVVPATPTGDRTYVVQAGQTLSSIANEIYGNPRFWTAIQRENKSISPSHLKVGTRINLPDVSPVQTVEAAADVETPGDVIEHSPRAVITPGEKTAPTDPHTYVVKSGDSLYKIARTVLGSGRKADELYAMNKVVIGPDKSRLKLGMVLKLPENAGNGVVSSAASR